MKRFGKEIINSLDNVIALTPDENAALNALYSSHRVDITGVPGVTVREWLSTKTFDEAKQLGLRAVSQVISGEWQ